MSGVLLLWLLLEPMLLSDWGGTGIGLTLQLDNLGLVILKLVGDVALLWRLWGLWCGENLDVADAVAGLDWGWLVGLELLEVQVLNEIGYRYRAG